MQQTNTNTNTNRDVFCNITIFCIILIITGLPLYFTGCNSKYTTYCPRYNAYNGTIYYIGAYDPGYTYPTPTNNTNTNTTLYYTNDNIRNSNNLRVAAYVPRAPINTNNDDEIDYKYYAIDLNTLQKCHIETFDRKLNYLQIGDKVNWYKFKNNEHNLCERHVTVEERWMAGAVLVITAFFIHMCADIVYYLQLYNKPLN